MFKLKFILTSSLAVVLNSGNVFAEPDPTGLYPQDSYTMVSDCMHDGNNVILAISDTREVTRELFEKHLGKEGELKYHNESIAKTRKAMAECEAKSPEEKAEIEKRYEREYGYKRPSTPPPYGKGDSGGEALRPGSLFNPIHVKVH